MNQGMKENRNIQKLKNITMKETEQKQLVK